MKNILLLLAGLMAPAAVSAADIYVSTSGNDSNPGTLEAPVLTLRKAIETATSGTDIYLRGGTYRPGNDDIMRTGAESVYSCVYSLDKKGTASAPITISGYPGEKVTIDLSDVKPGGRVIGFYMKADYWELRDFDIVGIQVTETGHTQSINIGMFGGSHCVVERVNMHDGMGIGVYATRGSDNLVVNCDAYNNYDPVSEGGKGGNCDGFGFHFNKDTYTGNVLRGCRAWRNSDDGFDLISNLAPVTIENCWAWENGYDADRVSRGDGTGFKSGGFGMGTVKAGTVAPRNTVRNCIAWANKQQGFYANHHLGGLNFYNNSAYRNKRNFNMVNRKSIAEAVDVDGYDHLLTGNVAYRPTQSGADLVNFSTTLSRAENNTFLNDAITLTDADFVSLDATQLLRERNADGSLPDIDFLRLRPGSAACEASMGWEFTSAAGVGGVEADVDDDTPFYNLQGIRVENPGHGLYIRGGRLIRR